MPSLHPALSAQRSRFTGALAVAALGTLFAGCASMSDRIALDVAPAANAATTFTCRQSSSGACIVVRGAGPALTVREGQSLTVPNLATGSQYCFAVRGTIDWRQCTRSVVGSGATTHSTLL